ncbi:protein unc-13 homolog [Gastrolobium bilobum]|uniref:protein unc-13 homolog n=1 Tax=Gastrolobium bilobum TaxID=150636 RepID=UPI002AB0E2DF|nr:protein unc-13 homolog [Gastrolobium bilobum]
MGQHTRHESYPSTSLTRIDFHHHGQRRLDVASATSCGCADDLAWPFGKLDDLDSDAVRETAYEIFFTSCRSSPGFGGRHALTFYSNYENGGDGGKSNQVVTKPTSRVKKALGLKMLRRSLSKRMVFGVGSNGVSSTPSSPVGGASSPLSHTVPPFRPRRPMTAAEIMRQQMRVTEHDDNKLRKTLMRTLVGQVGRRAETIILPLELLRHLKPSEFSDSNEYHMWQMRQLKILEAGLLLYPSIPLEKTNTFATRLRDIITSGESKPIDTGKNSDTMRTLCNSVVSLSWRSHNGTPTDVCHWADGFPFNIHLYTSLLQSIFDIRDDTLVLDEVDELLELIKKTWSTLGITLPIHNVCFTWVLFHQYIATGQIEPDLLCASHAMLYEVANDAKKEKESLYVKILSSVLSSMQGWAEKRLLNYHDYFQRGNAGQIENLLPVVLSASRILGEDLTITDGEGGEKGDITIVDSSGDRVDNYIRSSMKNAFEKVLEAVNTKYGEYERKKELSEVLLQLAQETEVLMMKERHHFSPMLKKWHSTSGAVAAMMLHTCYGQVLRQYILQVTSLTTESVQVLQRAGKLEKLIVQIVVEDSAECEDGGKTVVREMAPFDVDSVILSLLGKWIDESLYIGKECVQRAKETETWNPKSKSELYAQSAAELTKLAATTVEEFFQVPIAITEDLVQDLADGLENLFQDYMMFVAACGSKQSYIPLLPPLTRCNRDSKFIKLWKKAAPCSSGFEDQQHINGSHEGQNPRPSTSRGTQRLYVRLNTLHYLLTQIHSLEKSLSMNPGVVPSNRLRFANNHRRNQSNSSSYFEAVNLSILAACQHVSEVAAYRLVFLDSNSVFYESLYIGGVERGQIRAVLRILKQNITLMTTVLTDRAQPMAMKEVMKASFDSFLMVFLAGGSSRVFHRSDHEIIQEDFDNLKKVFSNCVEGLIAENVVDGEAAVVEGVIALMGQSTEQLMEDFSIVTCESSGMGVMGNGQKLPMPPTTGKWNRADPNTILRILCHRNDRAANLFLKRTFQLAKRR